MRSLTFLLLVLTVITTLSNAQGNGKGNPDNGKSESNNGKGTNNGKGKDESNDSSEEKRQNDRNNIKDQWNEWDNRRRKDSGSASGSVSSDNDDFVSECYTFEQIMSCDASLNCDICLQQRMKVRVEHRVVMSVEWLDTVLPECSDLSLLSFRDEFLTIDDILYNAMSSLNNNGKGKGVGRMKFRSKDMSLEDISYDLGDGEVSYSISEVEYYDCPTGCAVIMNPQDVLPELESYRSVWESNTLSGKYCYTYSHECLCDFCYRYDKIVCVEAESVSTVRFRDPDCESDGHECSDWLPELNEYYTIDDFFDFIEFRVRRGVHTFTIVYNEVYGYPMSVTIHKNGCGAQAISEETYTIEWIGFDTEFSGDTFPYYPPNDSYDECYEYERPFQNS